MALAATWNIVPYMPAANFLIPDDEPRRLHLGVDIWADAGTPVYVPLDGRIHSFRDNNHFGDYGPTVILQHRS